MKQPSDAQCWARERNWNKARITGARGYLLNIMYQKSTTPDEILDIRIATAALDRIIKNWKENNKKSKSSYLYVMKHASKKP